MYKYRAVANGFESLNYDDAENESIKTHSLLAGTQASAQLRAEALITWAAVISTGFLIGCIAFSSSYVVSLVVQSKFSLIGAALARGDIVTGWLIMSAFILGLSLLAAVLTRWAPEAAGSGIPHVKAYLNGVRLDGALRPRTLLAKVVGVSCCVACGMPAGREGPMVHAGAIVANIVGVARSRVLSSWARRAKARMHRTHSFHNDYDRRNFVSMGAAAGVAAAFHAPIGGILFALEEVSSYWNTSLTVFTFFTVASSTFTVMLWTDGIYGTFNSFGLVLFWDSQSSAAGAPCDGSLSASVGRRLAGASGIGRSPFAMWELLLFLCIAVGCGLLGATFNYLNKRITMVRKRLFASHLRWRVLEAVISIWLVISIFYFLPLAMPCRSADEEVHGVRIFDVGRSTFDPHGIYLVPYQCAQPTAGGGGGGSSGGSGSGGSGGAPAAFNDLATLLMQPQESAIKQLFSRSTAGYFSPTCLGIFILIYFSCALFLYGIAVPSGLFVPGLLIGGGIGRLVGECLYLSGGIGLRCDPGVYALIGAAGMLGGVTRMTMSLAVIIVELTNDIDLLLPIMLTIGIAKQVGDAFTPSVYDIHIRLQGVPMLEEKLDNVPPEMQGALNAKSVMSRNVVCVGPAESASRLSFVLSTTTHHAFPLVDRVTRPADPHGQPVSLPLGQLFSGMITRSKLERLLYEHQQGRATLVAASPAAEARSDANGHTKPNGAALGASPEGPNGSPHSGPGNARFPHRRSASAPAAASPPSSPSRGPASPPMPPSRGLQALSPRNDAESLAPLPSAMLPPASSRWKAAAAAPATSEEEPLIDLRAHCDRAPYVVSQLLPMHRVFRLFQTMGLRHLPVIDEHSHVVGMITRKDLLQLDERSLRLLANRRRADSWKWHEEKGLQEVRTSRHGGSAHAGSAHAGSGLSPLGGVSWLTAPAAADNGGMFAPATAMGGGAQMAEP